MRNIKIETYPDKKASFYKLCRNTIKDLKNSKTLKIMLNKYLDVKYI